jgi:hypothetical protein
MKNEATLSNPPHVETMDRNTTIEGAIWLLNNTDDRSMLHKSFTTIQANADYILKRPKYSEQLYHTVKKMVVKYRHDLDMPDDFDEPHEPHEPHEPNKPDLDSPKPRFLGTSCLYLTSFYCAFLALSAFLYYRTTTT